MASQDFSISLQVKLEDIKEGRKTAVTTVFKTPQGKESSHKVLVPAPPSHTKVTQAIGEALNLFVARGIDLVDSSGFKSEYKAEDGLKSATEMMEPGKPPAIPNPESKGKPEEEKKGEADKGKDAEKKPAPVATPVPAPKK